MEWEECRKRECLQPLCYELGFGASGLKQTLTYAFLDLAVEEGRETLCFLQQLLLAPAGRKISEDGI